ncbi:S9 family peptidase [Paenibacillus sp. FJAT-26967]|uniref:alpha/beta hydrolase family protein n=1 Tax=Paenibacillus sp. FJAT-26967 TaxID=1729690 RepID=UPI000838B4D8|nr:dienelactone hydrolase family protein [Paenibacillus sp. FJAT-26967]
MSVYRRELASLTAELTDPVQWASKRAAILKQWLELMGGLPERVPVRIDWLSSTSEAAHTRHHIRYDTVHGDQVTAYLLVPHIADGSGAQAPLPAVLALHPTADAGKGDIALASGRDGRKYALELVGRGYVVLAPDSITAGERREEGSGFFHTGAFYTRHPEWSAVGKMLADHLQGLDLLCTLPQVDSARIGAIGHSLGGYNAYFLAGVDERVRAVAVSCGLSTFHGDPEPERWGVRSWYTHLPEVTEALAQERLSFDFHEIAALAAPTPFFCWIAQQDTYMPHWQEIGEAAAELHQLYEFLGCGSRLQAVIGTSGHDFPEPVREWAYNFLDHWLRRST